MPQEEIGAIRHPRLVRALVWAIGRSARLRALALHYWPQGRLRRTVLNGYFLAVFEQLNRDRDLPASLLHPDFVLRFPRNVDFLARVPTMHGRNAVREMYDVLEEGFSEVRWVPERLLEAPGGRFVAFSHVEAAGGASGAPIRQPGAMVMSLKKGKLSEVDMYVDWGEALKAAGLPE